MADSNERSQLMAAEAVAEIVSQKLEILLFDPVCVGCLSIENHVKDAKAKLAVIQQYLATRYIQYIDTEWEGRLLRAMYYAEEFIEKFHLREARERKKALHRPLAALVSKYMLWRDLSHLVNAMKELCQERYLRDRETGGVRKKEPASALWQGKKIGRLPIFLNRQRWMNYLCREEEEKKLMKRIWKSTDLGVQAISILGVEGAGKTFLARRVYGEASWYQSFEWRAWVRVSTCMDQRDLLLEILKQVKNPPAEGKDMDFYEINKILRRKLAVTKRFLIVLDDVHPSHEKLLRGLVMITLPGSQGHIITTTQDARIAQIMNYIARPIELNDLSPRESQRMLAWKLHGDPDCSRLSGEEKNMLLRCPRLPLYISLLGSFLSNGGEHERTTSVDGSMMTLLDILQWSYHKLPVHLKPCFIYMALFPIAFPIPTRRLVRLWLAEGLLDSHCCDREGKMTRLPEDVGETFILELADRNVIDVVSWRADGSPKACLMLDSLYDMICPIAMSTGLLHIHGQQRQLPAQLQERTEVRWLAEQTDIVTDGCRGSFHDLYVGHVRSFLSFYLRRGLLAEDISTILKNMTSKTTYSMLRVLDLEGVYKPSLQGVLHKLVLLRYLGLRRTMLQSLPSTVADLHYLETLDIKHTNITSLPSSLWKARNLRHLHLHWFSINLKKILKVGGNNVTALSQLQTLSGLVIGEMRENSMTGLMDSLTTLATLKLFLKQSDGDTPDAAWVTVAHWISFGLTNLQSLTLGVINKAKPTKKDKTETLQIGPLPKLSLVDKHYCLLELYLLGQLNKPIWTGLLPVSLRVLTLSGSRVEIDMMPLLGGLLENLTTFRLLANSFLGTSLTFARDGFPSLAILKIWKLPQLEKVIIEEGGMPCLKELEFRHLNMMTNFTGVNRCYELEKICVVVKKGARGFVDHLNGEIGRKTSLYIIEDPYDDNSDEDASP